MRSLFPLHNGKEINNSHSLSLTTCLPWTVDKEWRLIEKLKGLPTVTFFFIIILVKIFALFIGGFYIQFGMQSTTLQRIKL
jgi:hypothetical protein